MSRETRSRDSSNYQNLSASKSYRFFQPLNVDGKICDSKLFRRKGKTIEINVDNVFMPKKHNRKQLPKKKDISDQHLFPLLSNFDTRQSVQVAQSRYFSTEKVLLLSQFVVKKIQVDRENYLVFCMPISKNFNLFLSQKLGWTTQKTN